jgi:hypothetical protein
VLETGPITNHVNFVNNPTPNSSISPSAERTKSKCFGKLEALAVLKTNPDEAGIVQAIGPLKTLAGGDAGGSVGQSRRHLVVTDMKDAWQVGLQQSTASTVR